MNSVMIVKIAMTDKAVKDPVWYLIQPKAITFVFVYMCACVVGYTCMLMMVADVVLDYPPPCFETDSMLTQLSVVLYQRRTCGRKAEHAQHEDTSKACALRLSSSQLCFQSI